jgi:hypothetical protein
MKAKRKNTHQPRKIDGNQLNLNRRESKLQTRENAYREAKPRMVPSADVDAKMLPRSKARRKTTGAELRGRLTNQPLTTCPHLLPA